MNISGQRPLPRPPGTAPYKKRSRILYEWAVAFLICASIILAVLSALVGFGWLIGHHILYAGGFLFCGVSLFGAVLFKDSIFKEKN